MSLENIPKPQISKDYNRQAIRLTMVAVGLIILLAVGNAVYKSLNPKVNVEQPAKEEVTSNETITDEDTMGGQKYYDKNKKENVSNINASSNVESNNNIETHQSQYVEQNYGYDKGELLRAYYAKLIQEEEQARSSGIGFSTGSSSGQNNGSSNSGYGNNQNNIYSQGNFPDQYTQQNMQEQKKDFLENAKQSKFYNSYQEEMPISKYEVMAGTFIPATLITGINSDLPSKSVAVVRENVYDSVTGNHLLIPKGTKIIGIYDSGIAFGQDRLLIVWQRLIFPNGKYIGLDNMGGIDLSGYAGFTGKVNNHFLKLLQAVVLSSAMGAGSAIVTDNDNDDWRSEAGKGAGQVILDFGNKMGEKILNRQPTIEIKQGYRFNIMVHSDLVLTPYGE